MWKQTDKTYETFLVLGDSKCLKILEKLGAVTRSRQTEACRLPHSGQVPNSQNPPQINSLYEVSRVFPSKFQIIDIYFGCCGYFETKNCHTVAGIRMAHQFHDFFINLIFGGFLTFSPTDCMQPACLTRSLLLSIVTWLEFQKYYEVLFLLLSKLYVIHD